MGAAAHVGRVGGLAVALGVGSAVFAGHGVAWAEGSDASPSRQTSSATSDSNGAAGGGSAGQADDAADSEEAGGQEGPDADVDDALDPDLDADPDETDLDPGDDSDEIDDPVGDTGVPDGADDPDVDLDESADPEATETEDQATTDNEAGTAPDSRGSSTADTATGSLDTTARQSTQPQATVDPDSAARTAGSDTPAASTAETTASSDDPAVAPTEPRKIAVFANASTLAAASPKAASPTASTVLFTPNTPFASEPKLVTAVVNIVNSMVEWARQRAAGTPTDSPQPPFLWALLSFARRELDNLFLSRSAVGAVAAAQATAAPTSMALAVSEPIAAAVAVPYSPWPNPQVSESTNFVSWVTGPYVYSDPTMVNTLARFQIYGTDVGTMWWNGMEDDPATPSNENQILIAVGDSYGGPNMSGRWIYNTLFRSSDQDLSDGMTIPNGEWFNGNMFGGAPLSAPTQARPIINRPSWLPNSVTLIPTAGVSVPTPDTQFGVTQYVSFMSVSKWGSAGQWDTNYSAIAYSTDNGENFTVAPESVRYNSVLSGNKNFQQSAFVTGDDGYVYVYGTPNGRQGAAYVARVQAEDILDLTEYEYYKKASSGWFGRSSAEWVKGNPSAASAVIGKDGGACGATKPGYSVSEMSVQYNEYLDKYVVLYGDQFNNIVMRTSDTPEGTWSGPTVLMGQQNGGIYAPMLHPWSPSTVGTGSDLYWNLSLWSEYNVMLMRTDLTKV